MAVVTTITATVPTGTSGSIIFYEDVDADGVGSSTDPNGRDYDNSQEITLEDGTNQYDLNNFSGGGGNEYWFDPQISSADQENGLVVTSVEIDPVALTGSGTLNWTSETDFDNVRDKVGIASDTFGSHPSEGTAIHGYPYGNLRRDLVLYFPFDSNKSQSTSPNAATQGNNAKLTNVSFSTDALVEANSASFSSTGSSAVVERYSGIELESGPFTISVAFKVSSVSTGSTYDDYLFGDKDVTGTADAQGFFIALDNLAGTVNVRAGSTDINNNTREAQTSGTNYADGQWHVATLVRGESGSHRLYIDGTQEASAGSNGDITSTNDIYMGIAHNDSTGDYGGLLEEARVYDRALSEREIEQLSLIRDTDAQVQTVNPLNGLVGRYDFEDISAGTITDTSGNSNDLTNSGVTSSSNRIINSSSGSFDGSSEATTTADILGGESNFTISAWFKTDVLPSSSGNNDGIAFAINGDFNDVYGLRLAGGAGGLAFQFDKSGSNDGQITHPNSELDTDTWFHAVATYDNGDMRLYVDGQLVGTDTSGSATSTSTGLTFRVGNVNDGDDFFNGNIDDVRLYNQTLTPAQVETLYDFQQPRISPFNSLENGIDGWWPLNDSSGNAADLTNNSNDGTVNNAPTPSVGLGGSGSYLFNGVDTNIVTGYANSQVSFSVSVWIKPVSSQAEFSGVLSSTNGTKPTGSWQFSFDASDNIIWSSDSGTVGSFGNISTGDWHHVVGVWNSESLQGSLYLNGSLVDIGSNANNLDFVNLVIGDNRGGDVHFDGNIQDVRLYTRRLSPKEINRLYIDKNKDISKATVDKDIAKFNGALSRYSFDDSDTSGSILTDTYGTNDGTISGGVTTGEAGVGEGQSYLFNGTDGEVDIPVALASSDSPFSISAWVKPSTVTGSNVVIGARVPNGNNFFLNVLDGAWDFSNFDDSAVAKYGVVGAGTVEPDTWYHALGTYNSGRYNLYINGVNIASVEDNFDPVSEQFGIGYAAGINSNYFEGNIDEIRLFNSELDSFQAWQLYSIGRNQNWVTHNE